MEIGNRIHYTGDMANIEDQGTISAIRPANKWGPLSYDIRLDDGREFRAVFGSAFSPGPGRRFWLLSDWQTMRQEAIAKMQDDLRALHNRLATSA